MSWLRNTKIIANLSPGLALNLMNATYLEDLAPEQLTSKKAGCSSAVYGKADVFLSFKIFNELSVTRNTHWRLYLQDHELLNLAH